MNPSFRYIKYLVTTLVWIITFLFSRESKLVPIKLELPKPMFIGTPQNLKVKNLQKPLGKPRPAFLAPVGTKNIALGKTI